MERESVRVIEVDPIDGFSLTKNRLSRGPHLGQSSQDSVDIEILDSPAEMREPRGPLPNPLRVKLRQRDVGWSIPDSENGLASPVVLERVNRHSQDSPIPAHGALQIRTPETHMVQRADVHRQLGFFAFRLGPAGAG